MSSETCIRLEYISMPPSCYSAVHLQQQDRDVNNNDDSSCSSSSEASSHVKHPDDNNDDDIDNITDDDEQQNANSNVVIDDSSDVDDDPRAPMMEAVIEEVRRTDNILVTEIGRSDLIAFIKHVIVAKAVRQNQCHKENGKCHQKSHCECDHWDFQDEKAFNFLMEIFQANIIYYLKFRYYEQKRGRYHPKIDNKDASNCNFDEEDSDDSCWSERAVIQDFLGVFTKAASSRYLPSRRVVAAYCFAEDVDIHKSETSHFHISRKIRRALVRLHRRAGIFLPHSKPTSRHHEYWITLWWTCSSILFWSLQPCLEITCLIDDRFCRCSFKQQQLRPVQETRKDPTKPPPTQKRRLDNGFTQQSQSYIAKLPLALIQREIRKVGLPFDNVLMHDGPWTVNDKDDEDYSDGSEISDGEASICHDISLENDIQAQVCGVEYIAAGVRLELKFDQQETLVENQIKLATAARAATNTC